MSSIRTKKTRPIDATDIKPRLTGPILISHLLLLRILSLGLSLSSLLTHTHEPRITPRPSQLSIRIVVSLRHITLLHLLDAMLDTNTIVDRQHTGESAHDLLGI